MKLILSDLNTYRTQLLLLSRMVNARDADDSATNWASDQRIELVMLVFRVFNTQLVNLPHNYNVEFIVYKFWSIC